MSKNLPHIYRLLAAFSGIPRQSVDALEAAGLREPGAARELSDYHRGLLRQLSVENRIRWVNWGPQGEGYVLTGYGEAALTRYFDLYGPANPRRQGKPLAQLLRERQARAAEEGHARSLT